MDVLRIHIYSMVSQVFVFDLSFYRLVYPTAVVLGGNYPALLVGVTVMSTSMGDCGVRGSWRRYA